VPALYPFRYWAVDGGLMSYGIDVLDLFRRTGSYVDRILKGRMRAEKVSLGLMLRSIAAQLGTSVSTNTATLRCVSKHGAARELYTADLG